MILFLYGENSFLSKEKLDAIKAKYLLQYAESADMTIIDAEFASANEIMRQVRTLPFLAKKRLVIIKNLLTQGKKEVKEKIEEIIKNVGDATILIIYENKVPDKRTIAFKIVKKLAQTQEFKMLEGYQLNQWIQKKLSATSCQFSDKVINKLILYCGNDLWRLNSEIEKIAVYSYNNIIDENVVENLVRAKVDSNIFNLVDAVSLQNSEKSIQELYKLYENSVYELVILSMITTQFRNLLLIKSSQSSAVSHQQIGLHPFVVQKCTNQCRNFGLEELKLIYKKILNFDIKIKRGEIEQRLGLEMLILQICGTINKRISTGGI